MKYVELYNLQNDGSQKVIVTCYLNDNGEVECEGDLTLAKNLKEEGVKDYSNIESVISSKLFFKDGLKFLEQLKFNFTSGYLNASEIKEK